MKITIAKLDHKIYCGDWHDKPLKWGVFGPGSERQNFATKADALLYRKIRRTSSTAVEAGNHFVATA